MFEIVSAGRVSLTVVYVVPTLPVSLQDPTDLSPLQMGHQGGPFLLRCEASRSVHHGQRNRWPKFFPGTWL